MEAISEVPTQAFVPDYMAGCIVGEPLAQSPIPAEAGSAGLRSQGDISIKPPFKIHE